jgi:hypothetical protein
MAGKTRRMGRIASSAADGTVEGRFAVVGDDDVRWSPRLRFLFILAAALGCWGVVAVALFASLR